VASSVDTRNPPDPQASQFERVPAAMKVQCSAADSPTADECHLYLVDIGASRRFWRRCGLSECVGRDNTAQHHGAERGQDAYPFFSDKNYRSFFAWNACTLPGEEEADITGHPSRIFEHLGPQVKSKRPQVIVPEFVAGARPTL
jgi:hypothetical protein